MYHVDLSLLFMDGPVIPAHIYMLSSQSSMYTCVDVTSVPNYVEVPLHGCVITIEVYRETLPRDASKEDGTKGT